MDEDTLAIIIDNGTDMIKSGFAGGNPRGVFSTVIGTPKHGDGNHYIGEEAQTKRDILNLSYPIERGIITNWDDMEKIWQYTFDIELRAFQEEHAVMLTESPLNTKANREKMTQIMFETFNVPYVYVAKQPELSLYCSGRTTGIVVHSGEDVTCTVPIYEGSSLSHATNSVDFAGTDITKYLMTLLQERGLSVSLRDVRDIKEKLAYVATDYEEELKQPETLVEQIYDLPDGNAITIGVERFKCTEALFQPSFIGVASPGVHELVCDSIIKCDADIRDEMYKNVWLASGNTMFQGVAKRLEEEIVSVDARVFAPPERKYSVWVGASLLAAMQSTQWISKDLYEEYGACTVNWRCF
jgi:actin